MRGPRTATVLQVARLRLAQGPYPSSPQASKVRQAASHHEESNGPGLGGSHGAKVKNGSRGVRGWSLGLVPIGAAGGPGGTSPPRGLGAEARILRMALMVSARANFLTSRSGKQPRMLSAHEQPVTVREASKPPALVASRRQPSASQVCGPTMPSATRPQELWKERTALAVIGPNWPSTETL